MVHLQYDKQFKNHFCLTQIARLQPDKDDVVRTVVVKLRDKKTGPRGNHPNQEAGQTLGEPVPVQRLHMTGALKGQVSI